MSKKPAWLVAMMLKQCGVPCAEQIAMMLAKCKKQPDDTPTASMYLYGTPSDSGNIGLRDGDTVTYYKGTLSPTPPVWPALPNYDTSTYRYAYVYLSDIDYTTIGLHVTSHAMRGSGAHLYHGTASESKNYTLRDGEWVLLSAGSAMANHVIPYECYIWSNVPSYSLPDLFTSSPPIHIPVGETVDTIDGIPIYEVI